MPVITKLTAVDYEKAFGCPASDRDRVLWKLNILKRVYEHLYRGFDKGLNTSRHNAKTKQPLDLLANRLLEDTMAGLVDHYASTPDFLSDALKDDPFIGEMLDYGVTQTMFSLLVEHSQFEIGRGIMRQRIILAEQMNEKNRKEKEK